MRYLYLLLLLALPILARAQAARPADPAPTATLAQLAPPDTAGASAPAAPPLPADTTLPALASPPDTLPASFQGLSEAERRAQGRADARRHYRARGVFWAGAGLGLAVPVALTPVSTPAVGLAGGFGAALSLGLAGPSRAAIRATAPQPAYLSDASYRQGYAAKAYEKRLGKTMLGWGVGTATLLTAAIIALSVVFSNFSFGG